MGAAPVRCSASGREADPAFSNADHCMHPGKPHLHDGVILEHADAALDKREVQHIRQSEEVLVACRGGFWTAWEFGMPGN